MEKKIIITINSRNTRKFPFSFRQLWPAGAWPNQEPIQVRPRLYAFFHDAGLGWRTARLGVSPPVKGWSFRARVVLGVWINA